MTRTLTLSLALGAAMYAGAAVTVPRFWQEDFIEMEQRGDVPDNGWTVRGNGATPAQDMTEYFGPAGDGPVYLLFRYNGKAYAFSCTNFDPPQAADQWLISPPIEIADDNAELSFTGAVFCNRGNWGLGRNPIKAVVIDEADGSETTVYDGSVNGSSTSDVNTKNIYCPLNGFGGKTVRLAFVSTGEDLGMTGFTDIALGSYAITFDNKTIQVADPGQEVTVDVNVGMKTPVACAGFTAVLEAGGQTQTKTFTKQFGNTGYSLLYQRVTFEPMPMDASSTLNYTVTITPNYEGAVASVLTGSIGLASIDYLNNVVMEELTATGCKACPSGAASAEYYHDTYPDLEGQGKFITIAIHGIVDYADPMNEGVQDYVNSTQARNETTVFPQAIFNRSSRGLMPERRMEVENQMARRSYNMASITAVEAPAADNPWGEHMTVNFEVRNAYAAENRPLTAAVVLVENDVRGNTGGYSQTNGFYDRDTSYIESAYGDFLVPYMLPYLQGGSLGLRLIPFDRMTYQHVARVIYPSYAGQLLTETWEADTPQPFSITLPVPDNVMELPNTEAIILVMDDLGNIVASDKMAYSNFNSGVGTVGDLDGVKVSNDGTTVNVEAPASATTEVYTPDGVLRGRINGCGSLDLAPGVTLVRISSPNGTVTRKIML